MNWNEFASIIVYMEFGFASTKDGDALFTREKTAYDFVLRAFAAKRTTALRNIDH